MVNVLCCIIFSTQEFKCPVSIKAIVGELVKPNKITPESFKKEQGLTTIIDEIPNICSLCILAIIVNVHVLSVKLYLLLYYR